MTNTSFSDEEVCEKLLTAVKKEVKQIMEEAVTKKFIHEESSSIISLCGAVECCLQHGLKKRALGLFKNSTTTALLHKISKQSEAAAQVVRVLTEVENNHENARKNLENGKNGSTKRFSPPNAKYLWIRVALFEKQLHKIIDYLVENASKYYEKESLISDPCNGPVLSALLVGPCALDYTKMKTADHYWTDPPADELVQRHRIHSSGAHMRPDSPKRPGLQVANTGRRHTSSSSEERERVTPLSAKEYVESLHQNSKTQLLYGKNNVIVQPKEDISPLAGYLSLHHGTDGLTIKWTPNQLMNGCCEEDEQIDRSLYWDYAVTIYLEEIVYLHCHQQPDSGGTIVLVGQDGVQRPPIHFPKGGHLLAFLSCLENGLLPHGQLDPPLWSQRGKGKVFPRLKRKASRLSQLSSSSIIRSQDSTVSAGSVGGASISSDDSASLKEEEEEATDYVFRIVTSFRPDNIPSEMLDPKAKSSGNLSSFAWMHKEQETKPSKPPMSTGITSVKTYARSQEQKNSTFINKNEHRSAVKQLCDTMKNQILSRAFYGWLSYCRHLKTVRTHLSGLVNSTLVSVDQPHDASSGLTVEKWQELCQDGVVQDSQEIYRLVYYGGCAHDIRIQVWPYLLGHYAFGSTAGEREKLDEEIKSKYELTMSEWLAVEAIVKQKDKELLVANLVKFPQESTDGHIPLVRKDSSLSNDVFESIDSEDFSHPETVPEETSSQLVTPTGEEEQRLPTLALGEIKQKSISSTKSSSLDNKGMMSPDEGIGSSVGTSIGHSSSVSDSKRSDSYDTEPVVSSSQRTSHRTSASLSDDLSHDSQKSIIVTQATVDANGDITKRVGSPLPLAVNQMLSTSSADGDVSPASNASNGGVYSTELVENVALNLHRIDKDVQRCDRNYFYFTPSNLDKLRNVMCTYVWENLEIGYVQGMCDILAPLLVITDDESRAYSLFCQLMKRMNMNFPHGGAMDQHFANMRSLIQILDPETFEHMHQNGDYTHFYFCYRWFLLDFKRELVYDDVFSVWETIWSAKHVSSPHFVLFIALALVQYYREIIIDNNMDFTDIIKFFNEMAERHSIKQVLRISRDLVYKLQDLIENK